MFCHFFSQVTLKVFQVTVELIHLSQVQVEDLSQILWTLMNSCLCQMQKLLSDKMKGGIVRQVQKKKLQTPLQCQQQTVLILSTN